MSDEQLTPNPSSSPAEEDFSFLKDIKTIAVVGLSDKEDRPSYVVAAYLKEQGYTIVPVNPNVASVLDEKAYASLGDIEGAVDLVDVFRKSEDVPGVVDEAIAKGCHVIWLQEGVIHDEAAQKAREAGIMVVMDRCIKKVHAALSSDAEENSPEAEEAAAEADETLDARDHRPLMASPTSAREIFVMTGHDEKFNRQLLRFLKEQEVEPVLVHDARQRKDLIEEGFEKYPHIKHAVIVFSADAWTYPMNTKPADANTYPGHERVFEAGLLVGRLGRVNTCLMIYEQKRFMLPSHFLSIMGVPYNRSDEWKRVLLRKLDMWGMLPKDEAPS